MAQLLDNAFQWYTYVDSFSDREVKNWYLMYSEYLPLAIIGVYLLFVLETGPRMMQNRKPYNITSLVALYNVIQIVFNAYICKTTAQYIWNNTHRIRCFEIEAHGTVVGAKIRNLLWLVVINKVMDLFDTVFFVLRKKQSFVTFLHVYHHTITFGGAWVITRYYPGQQRTKITVNFSLYVIATWLNWLFRQMTGGPIIIGILLNSFVHSVLYAYYLLTLIPSTRKLTTFFKKQLTQLQISHIVATCICGIRAFTDSACSYPSFLFWVAIVQGFALIGLFGNFYIQAYRKRQPLQLKSANNIRISESANINRNKMYKIPNIKED